jgi:hypothetical protein
MVMSEKSWTAVALEQRADGMNVVGRVVSAPHDTGPAFNQVRDSLPSSWFLVAIIPGDHPVVCPNVIKVALSADRSDLLFGYGDDGDFFSDREADPHDGSMYGEPEGGYNDGDA